MNCPYCKKADPGTIYTCPECNRKGCAECMKVDGGDPYVEGDPCNQCKAKVERAARADMLSAFGSAPVQP